CAWMTADSSNRSRSALAGRESAVRMGGGGGGASERAELTSSHPTNAAATNPPATATAVVWAGASRVAPVKPVAARAAIPAVHATALRERVGIWASNYRVAIRYAGCGIVIPTRFATSP